jgi:hypothetical protein
MQMVLSAKNEGNYNHNNKEVVSKDDLSPLTELSKQKAAITWKLRNERAAITWMRHGKS